METISMNEPCLVFGGWGCDAEFMRCMMLGNHIFVDINTLIPSVIDSSGMLLENWTDHLVLQVQDKCRNKEVPVVAWSTGAIVAYALLRQLSPPRATFIAATPSFCIRPGFPHGHDPRILRIMKRQLLHNRTATLHDFYRRCGIGNPVAVPCIHPTAALVAGLDFLEQVSLLPIIQPSPIPLTFIHGSHDQIVPPAAGQWFAQHTGGRFIMRSGGHALFASEG